MDYKHDVTKSEEIFDDMRKSPKFPKHARSASKTLVVPTLSVRKSSYGNKSGGERSRFSYESSESFGSLGTEPLSVGSFSASDMKSFNTTTIRNKSHSVNPFELSAVSVDSSSSRRWSHMYPRVTGKKVV